MVENEKLKQIINNSKEKLSQIEKLISLIDELLKSSPGKPYSLLELATSQKINPLQALIQNEHYFDLINLYPHIIWSSIFLTSYSIFESTLDEVCNYFVKENGMKINLNDLRHKGIFRSKLFITKILKVKFPDATCEWAFIINCKEVRNCIMHRSSDISNYKEKDGIIKFISNEETINEIDNKVIIEKEFSLKFITKCESIIDSLLDNLKKDIDGKE